MFNYWEWEPPKKRMIVGCRGELPDGLDKKVVKTERKEWAFRKNKRLTVVKQIVNKINIISNIKEQVAQKGGLIIRI